MTNIKVKKLHKDAIIPKRAHASDAGFDIYALEDKLIEPGETALVKTGLAFELPPGYEMQIRPRSGITLKTKLRVQLGTVDSGYAGEVGVIVDNNGRTTDAIDLREGRTCPASCNQAITLDGDYIPTNEMYKAFPYIIRKGDRIAQAVIQRLPDVELVEVEELGDSERGAGGFGSTGVSSEKTWKEAFDEMIEKAKKGSD